ncbi:hypothetical protein MRX96_005014 [Rhipicephalus microplus]
MSSAVECIRGCEDLRAIGSEAPVEKGLDLNCDSGAAEMMMMIESCGVLERRRSLAPERSPRRVGVDSSSAVAADL